ncbi:MAG: ATP-binding protein [Anaerolineae bacterium]|nr:ATP-binding protein [Anaerolineae bacterium]
MQWGISKTIVVEVSASQRFPGRYESLTKIAEFIRCACAQAGFDSCTTYSVETAVDEACSNIIEHAYGGEDIGEICCTCHLEEDRLVIILQDNGKPFKPEKFRIPKDTIPLKKYKRKKKQGLGLYFIYKIMDEVSFATSPSEGNTLTLVKYKSSPPPQA